MDSLESACGEAMQQPGVLGVVCADSQGLSLYSKGAVPDASSGAVAQIVATAAELCGGDDGTTVRIESAQRIVVLSKADGVTTALFMAPSTGS